MFARWARVAPARVRASPGSENLISSFFSVCTTDALEAVDDRAALEIFQSDRQARLATIGIEAEIADVALLLQHLDDGGLQARGAELHFALARGLAVADTGQQVGDGVSHAHGQRPSPARLGEARNLAAACDLADLHPREPELTVYTARAPGDGTAVAQPRGTRIARHCLQRCLRGRALLG